MSRQILIETTDAATQALDRFHALEQERLAVEVEVAYAQFQQIVHDYDVSNDVDAAFDRLLGR